MKVKSVKPYLAAAALVAFVGLSVRAQQSGAAAAAPDAAASAQDKSGGLFPNDFGPAEIDVSGYPKEQREAYRLMTFKCAACHTVARPINAQYLELTQAEEAQARKDDPELFKDDKVVKIGDGADGSPERKIWARYVKRMMAKPGCPVKAEDGKKIYEFLVFDAKIRKMGENAKAWREHRQQLLADFKEKHPDAYAKIFVDSAQSKGK